jgi:hypothetical protein
MNPAIITATVAQYESIEIAPRTIVQGKHAQPAGAGGSLLILAFLLVAVSLSLCAILGRD